MNKNYFLKLFKKSVLDSNYLKNDECPPYEVSQRQSKKQRKVCHLSLISSNDKFK